MNYRAVLFLAVMCLAISQLAHAQTEPLPIDDPGEPEPIIQPHPCPEQSGRAERYLQLYLALEYHAPQRKELGIDHLDPESVSTITDEEICGHIIHE